MEKRLISIVLIVTILLTLTSCTGVKNDNATIQLWWYNYSNSGWYTNAVENVLTQLKIYCDENSIPLEIVKYGQDTLAYEDYVLKRNSAMANGNMITIDDARRLHDIEKYHADYSKVENYNQLFDVYKDRFCIPIGIGYRSKAINNLALEYYGINTENSVITYDNYLEIKQQMKKNGAQFRLNQGELNELTDYYLIKNGLRYINEDSQIIDNAEEFKQVIKKSAVEIYDDIKTFYEDYEEFEFSYNGDWSDKDFVRYDKNSGLELKNDMQDSYMITYYSDYMEFNADILSKTFVVSYGIFNSPCVFMHKKITNKRIYDVFNKLIDESQYIVATIEKTHGYSPVQNTEKIREILEVDDNWEYNGEYINIVNNGNEIYKKIVDVINESYEVSIKDKESSKLLASYYFNNWEYAEELNKCMYDIISHLLANKIDYASPEGDKFMNEYIDEFITNFNVHYN